MDTNASLTYFAINSAVFASVNVATSVFSILMNIFFIYCMVFQQSDCAIIIYLWKHLKNMEKSSTLSSPRFQRQIRMTIRRTTITQGGVEPKHFSLTMPPCF
ncbi:uncharacterized protein LOC132850558 [Tachysurus vachellii]|uniref:uncharacterized protein LOC132850558 n=1 Tax=Tachysurus vachellii TaxID=175792 RepID=UPI00296AF111|nr:uncharacterized protein LOC132850558 [Tachysurus vachellii]